MSSITLDSLYHDFEVARSNLAWLIPDFDNDKNRIPDGEVMRWIPIAASEATDRILTCCPFLASSDRKDALLRLQRVAQLYLVAVEEGLEATMLWKLSQP
jgi:hypothetical protein